MSQPTTERFIICGAGEQPWVCCDEFFKMDRFATIAWIASGEFRKVAQVIAFDLTTGKCRDASEEIAREVMTRWAHSGEPLESWQYEYVELNVGTRAARSFLRAA